MAHLDQAAPKESVADSPAILEVDALRSQGSWGIFHELGCVSATDTPRCKRLIVVLHQAQSSAFWVHVLRYDRSHREFVHIIHYGASSSHSSVETSMVREPQNSSY